jgi:hypothetical protein
MSVFSEQSLAMGCGNGWPAGPVPLRRLSLPSTAAH